MEILKKFLIEKEKPLEESNRRYFKIAGITVCIESDLDFDKIKFINKFDTFAVDGPGEDNVILRHYFYVPEFKYSDIGEKVYHKAPWMIYRKDNYWIYLCFVKEDDKEKVYKVAIFNQQHTIGKIFNNPEERDNLYEEGFFSLAFFPTDQIWIAPLLADRNAFYLHSSAAIINGKGLIFVGHSEAGKSTTLKMLKGKAEILCDDRNILRRWESGWQVHGTWSHGEIPDVSSSSAPLRAVCILTKDKANRLERISDHKEILKVLLSTLVKPVASVEWWHKELDALEKLVKEVPVYRMRFDKSGEIVEILKNLTKKNEVL